MTRTLLQLGRDDADLEEAQVQAGVRELGNASAATSRPCYAPAPAWGCGR